MKYYMDQMSTHPCSECCDTLLSVNQYEEEAPKDQTTGQGLRDLQELCGISGEDVVGKFEGEAWAYKIVHDTAHSAYEIYSTQDKQGIPDIIPDTADLEEWLVTLGWLTEETFAQSYTPSNQCNTTIPA